MPETTPNGAPYPLPGDPNDVPGYIQQLAEWADEKLAAPADINDAVMAAHAGNPASTFAQQQANTYPRRSEVMLKASRYGWSKNNNATANDAAIADAIADAATERQALGVRSVVIDAGRGRFVANPDELVLPGGVSLYGEDRESTVIVNDSTAGNDVFINAKGSGCRVRGMTVDGQRAAQAAPGLAAIQFSRPNNPTAGGTNISGGFVLTGNVNIGATSIGANTHSPAGEPIRPGDPITLVEGSVVEQLRVSRTYVPGNLTITLEAPVANAFTTAAKASVGVGDVDASDCLVYSNGRDGIAFWHAIGAYADRNIIRDFEDTGIDFPSGGSRDCHARWNDIETKGRWGIAFDEATTEFGRLGYCHSKGNTIRFLDGGSGFLSGGAVDGIYFGVSEGCSSTDDIVDLTHAGLSGFRLAGAGADFCEEARIVNPTVRGPATPRANTFGIRSTMGALDAVLNVQGGDLSGVEKCIEADSIRTAMIAGVRARNYSAHGINFLGDGTAAQLHIIMGCVIDGGVTGVRFGGTGAHASNKVRTIGNIIRGQSFAPVVADAGWNHTADNNIP